MTLRPFSIHLREDLSADWIDKTQATRLKKQFLKRGFVQGDAYTIDEMENVRLVSFFHNEYTGVIYEVGGAGYFYDIMHEDVEQRTLTVTTSPFADRIELPPRHEKVYLSYSDVAEGFAYIYDICRDLETKKVEPKIFRESYESYYKEEQTYRNKRGGTSYNEFLATIQADAGKYTEEQLRTAFIELKKDELDLWSEIGLKEFYENENLSIEQHYEESVYIVVPRKTDAEAFVHFLNGFALIRDDHVNKVAAKVRGEEDIIQLFDRINSARSPELRAKACGEIAFPVEARIYKLAA